MRPLTADVCQPLTRGLTLGSVETGHGTVYGIMARASDRGDFSRSRFITDQRVLSSELAKRGLSANPETLKNIFANSDTAQRYAQDFARARYLAHFGMFDQARDALLQGAQTTAGDKLPEYASASLRQGLLTAIERHSPRASSVTLPTKREHIGIHKLRETLQTALTAFDVDAPILQELESYDAGDVPQSLKERIYDLVQPLLALGISPDLHADGANEIVNRDYSEDALRMRLEALSGQLVSLVYYAVANPQFYVEAVHRFTDRVAQRNAVWAKFTPALNGLGYDVRHVMPKSLQILTALSEAQSGDLYARERVLRHFDRLEMNAAKDVYVTEDITDNMGKTRRFFPRIVAAQAIYRIALTDKIHGRAHWLKGMAIDALMKAASQKLTEDDLSNLESITAAWEALAEMTADIDDKRTSRLVDIFLGLGPYKASRAYEQMLSACLKVFLQLDLKGLSVPRMGIIIGIAWAIEGLYFTPETKELAKQLVNKLKPDFDKMAL